MKTFFVIQISLLLAFPLYAQDNSSLGKVDTVTMGEYDDANPVLIHGTFSFGYSQPYQWLLFGRNTESSSEIVGKKFLLGDALWDSSVVSISSSHIPMSQRNPDISEISFSRNNFSHTFQFAAWEQRETAYGIFTTAVSWTTIRCGCLLSPSLRIQLITRMHKFVRCQTLHS